MKYVSYKATGTYSFLEDGVIRKAKEDIFYKTYGSAVSEMVIFSLLLLIMHYPEKYEEEYGSFRNITPWFKITPQKAITMFDEAFASGMITSQNKHYESAFEAWGNHPERITAEIPGTDKYFDFTIEETEDLKIFETRCDDCLWLTKKRKMPWCNHANKACKNVDECPEKIW